MAKGNTTDLTRPGLRTGPTCGQGVSNGLDRVREVARKDKQAKFTALIAPHRLRPPEGRLFSD